MTFLRIAHQPPYCSFYRSECRSGAHEDRLRLRCVLPHDKHRNFGSSPRPCSSFGEERENYFVGRLTQGVRLCFTTVRQVFCPGLLSFAPLELRFALRFSRTRAREIQLRGVAAVRFERDGVPIVASAKNLLGSNQDAQVVGWSRTDGCAVSDDDGFRAIAVVGHGLGGEVRA